MIQRELLYHQFDSYNRFASRVEDIVGKSLFVNRKRNAEANEYFIKTKEGNVIPEIERIHLPPPHISEEECFTGRLPYLQPVMADIAAIGEKRILFKDILLGSFPKMTSRGTFLFGKKPVIERTAIVQLIPISGNYPNYITDTIRELGRKNISAEEQSDIIVNFQHKIDKKTIKLRGNEKELKPGDFDKNYWVKKGREISNSLGIDLSEDDKLLQILSIEMEKPNLDYYKLITVENLLKNAINRAIKRINGYFRDKELHSYYEIEHFLFPCLPRMFQATVESYLSGSELMQLLDKTNPLAEIAHKRKVTFCGKKGLRNFFGDSIKERDVNDSQQFRLCPVETCESMKIGLNLNLALGAVPASDMGTINTYNDCKPSDILGISSALIPFVHHDDMNRAMMGAKNMKQALPLLKLDPPLVNTGFEEMAAKESHLCIFAENDGIFTVKEKDSLSFKYDNEERIHRITTSIFPGIFPGAGGFLRFDAHNKEELSFKKGEILADCSCSKDGELCLGANLLVAYMPWYGYNFEDAIVISSRLVEEDILTSLHVSKKWEGDKEICFIEERKIAIGDKLSGRHGNKGVVSLILPWEKMPIISGDGRHVDVLLNPMGVISRMNVGQLLETHWGYIADKKGIRITASPFDSEYNLEKLSTELSSLGMPDGKKEVLWQDKSGKEVRAQVAVGLQYLMKLNHCSKDKFHFRGEDKKNRTPITLQPPKGKKRKGGQRIGEMEVWSLQAHRANENLKELLTIKSDLVKAGDIEELKITKSLSQVIPESSRVFLLHLLSLGIESFVFLRNGDDEIELNIHKAEFDECLQNPELLRIELELSKSNEINKKFPHEIVSPDYLENKYFCTSCSFSAYREELSKKASDRVDMKCPQCKEKLEIREEWSRKGLFSPAIYGENSSKERYQGAHIKLIHPVPHPLFFENNVKRAKTNGCVGHEHSSDYLNTLYVLPPALRPVNPERYEEGINLYYRKIILANSQLTEWINNNKDLKSKSNDERHRIIEQSYKWRSLVKNTALLFGKKPVYNKEETTDGKTTFKFAGYKKLHGNEWYNSIPARIEGKKGLIRGFLLGKRVESSGRSVIIPDPELPFGSCRIPGRIADYLLRPHNIKESGDDDVFPAFLLADDKYVLLNRAPSLHRYNFLAFKNIFDKWGTGENVISLHPLACAGFGADFDGDTIGIHLPITKEAVRECERLLPENHLFSVSNGNLVLSISQDIVAGIYLLTKSNEGRRKLSELLESEEIATLKNPVGGKTLLKFLKNYLSESINKGHKSEALNRMDELMKIAFREATENGLSFSIMDLCDISLKIGERKDIYERLISQNDQDSLVERTGEMVIDRLKESSKSQESNTGNAIADIVLSGARGDKAQLGKICGGAVRPENGDIPGNLLEGLLYKDYFEASKKARREMAQKKLGTPKGGDLTRKLVYGLYPLVISGEQCDDDEGISIKLQHSVKEVEVLQFIDPLTHLLPPGLPINESSNQIKPEHLYGKYLAEDVGIFKKGTAIDSEVLKYFSDSTGREVRIFSPLSCKNRQGICARCYGWDLSTSKPPEPGLPIGIIAAQSIGERATQDFMKVFHGIKSSATEAIVDVKNFLEWGILPTETTDWNDISFLSWLTGVYDNKVNIRHFEVVLKQSKAGMKYRGMIEIAKSRSEINTSQFSIFSSLAFQSPLSVLKNIGQKIADDLLMQPAPLMFGIFDERRGFDCRHENKPLKPE